MVPCGDTYNNSSTPHSKHVYPFVLSSQLNSFLSRRFSYASPLPTMCPGFVLYPDRVYRPLPLRSAFLSFCVFDYAPRSLCRLFPTPCLKPVIRPSRPQQRRSSTVLSPVNTHSSPTRASPSDLHSFPIVSEYVMLDPAFPLLRSSGLRRVRTFSTRATVWD
jgi:hypothetical protein